MWLDGARMLVSIEHETETTRTTRLTVVDTSDPFPRRLVTQHDGLEAIGDEEEAAVSPDGSEVATSSVPGATAAGPRSASSRW